MHLFWKVAAFSFFLVDVGERLLVCGVAVDEGFGDWFTSSPIAFNQCYSVGGLPKNVQGTYLIGSIGQFEMGDRKFTGILDGFGKWNRFVLDGAAGKICASAQMINSSFYRRSLAKNTIDSGVLLMSTEPPRSCPPLQPMCQLLTDNDNIFVLPLVLGEPHGMRFAGTTDSPEVLEYDMENLGAPSKLHDWTDGLCKKDSSTNKCTMSTMHGAHIQTTGSAHFLPWKGGYVGLFTDVPMALGKTYVTVYRIGKDGGKREVLASLPMDETGFFHSFGVTDDFVVLPVQPLKLQMGSLFMGKSLSEAFAMSDRQAQICLFPLTPAGKAKLGGKEYSCASAPKFYFAHTVNAYQTDSGVVIDLCSSADGNFIFGPMATVAFMQNKTLRDSYGFRAGVQRFEVQFDGLNAVSVTEVGPPGVIVDMPRVNPNHIGKPYCVFFALEFWHGAQEAKRTYAEMAVYRQDICTGKRTYFQRPALFPSEPYMIPTSGTDEEEGILVFTAFKGDKNSSSLVVLDAKSMTELGDLALPEKVPFTIHGNWFPGWMPKQDAPIDVGAIVV